MTDFTYSEAQIEVLNKLSACAKKAGMPLEVSADPDFQGDLFFYEDGFFGGDGVQMAPGEDPRVFGKRPIITPYKAEDFSRIKYRDGKVSIEFLNGDILNLSQTEEKRVNIWGSITIYDEAGPNIMSELVESPNANIYCYDFLETAHYARIAKEKNLPMLIDEGTVLAVNPSMIGKSVSIPEGVVEIAPAAFSGLEHIESISLPDSVEMIGEFAFYMVPLESLELPASLNSIGDYAFSAACINKISFPESVEDIGDCAFEDCALLAEVEGLTPEIEIGHNAFNFTAWSMEK